MYIHVTCINLVSTRTTVHATFTHTLSLPDVPLHGDREGVQNAATLDDNLLGRHPADRPRLLVGRTGVVVLLEGLSGETIVP